MRSFSLHSTITTAVVLGCALVLSGVHVRTAQADCSELPDHEELRTTLESVVDAGGNAGLDNEMWGTIVDRDGIVCAVAFTGEFLGDQWPGSRVISAQKASTANAFSLPSVVSL